MNRPQVFQKVKKHLLTQMERSVMRSTCRYRGGPNGISCAVGCLIPNELYDPWIEGMDVTGLMVTSKFDTIKRALEIDSDEDLDLLVRLQCVHDGIFPSEWAKCLDQLSAYWKTAHGEDLEA